ncbi:hypothetical protein [Actinoplanes solisilvae]|uniref:hypothetical protein n=1 Tax=Actinoplanes solisilvae TaxID=2486853 RepID=UPI0013E3D8B8|nr:hypothetical protein [Actinoplanes solisilvae]
MNRGDPLADLANLNPVPEPAPGDPARLTVLRTVVDGRRSAAAPASKRSRRGPQWPALLAGFTVAAVAVPLALTVAVPEIWSRTTGQPAESAPLIDAAIAADGSLDCGGDSGYAAPIRPDQSPVRLWPSTLPSGWKVMAVFARSMTATAACRTPSLVAGRFAGGTMTGRVSVIGPARGISATDGRDDTVDGQKARRFVNSGPDSYSWLWTDARKRQWYATVEGYPLKEARAVLAATGTDGDEATWNPGAAPGLTLLHRRSGPPYPKVTRTDAWYIRLHDGRRERDIMIEGGRGRPLASAAIVGFQVRTVAGHTEQLSGFGPPHGAETDRIAYETEDGTWALAEVEGQGDLAEMRTVLTGLRKLPADDPRLDEYALRE